MFKELFKNYIYPASVFAGGMVGVGFLSLPYIASKVGIWVMLGYFVALTAIVLVINLIFCQISLKTPDLKRFPGFVGYYLGKRAEIFAIILTIIGTFGVLLAYLIVGGQFLSSVFQPFFSGSEMIYIFIYFIVASIIIYFDIKVVARAEFWILILLFVSLVLVFLESFSYIKINNIFIPGQSGLVNLFLPYGPLLFAFWGIGLIPELEEMLVGRKKQLKKGVVISTILTSVFYFIFVVLILGVTGGQTSQTALAGLKSFLNSNMVSVALLMGALATFVAFITQGLIFKKTLVYDLKIKHWQAFVMTCSPPMILLLLGLKSFIPILSFIGGVILGIDGIFILLMYKKIGGKNIIIYPLSLIFLLGVIYEVVYFVF